MAGSRPRRHLPKGLQSHAVRKIPRMEKTGGHKRPLKVVVEPKRTLAHKVHPFLRSLAGWFLMGVFDTFTEPMFSAIHNVIVWLVELLARILLGA